MRIRLGKLKIYYGDRKKKKKVIRPEYVNCLYCNNSISPGRDGRRKYCNSACKQAAYRNRKDGNLEKSKSEFVYFAQDKYSKFVKIGRTLNIENRMRDLSRSNSGKLDLLGYIPCENSKQLESAMHKFYKTKRVKGEWFRLSEEDISGLTKRAADASPQSPLKNES